MTWCETSLYWGTRIAFLILGLGVPVIFWWLCVSTGTSDWVLPGLATVGGVVGVIGFSWRTASEVALRDIETLRRKREISGLEEEERISVQHVEKAQKAAEEATAKIKSLNTEIQIHLHGATSNSRVTADAARANLVQAEHCKREAEVDIEHSCEETKEIQAKIETRNVDLVAWRKGRWYRAIPWASGIIATGFIVLPDFAALMSAIGVQI